MRYFRILHSLIIIILITVVNYYVIDHSTTHSNSQSFRFQNKLGAAGGALTVTLVTITLSHLPTHSVMCLPFQSRHCFLSPAGLRGIRPGSPDLLGPLRVRPAQQRRHHQGQPGDQPAAGRRPAHPPPAVGRRGQISAGVHIARFFFSVFLLGSAASLTQPEY